MSKTRIACIVSLLILAVVIVLTVFRPMTAGEKYSEVSREQLLQTEDAYIIEFDIIKHEGEVCPSSESSASPRW